MTRVEQLEQQIVALNADEFAQLREWLMKEIGPTAIVRLSVTQLPANWIVW
jgi:hypothetical protein